MTQAPERKTRPQMNNLTSSPVPSMSQRRITTVSPTNNPSPSTSPILQWFYDLSIRKKQFLVLVGAQALSIIALLAVGRIEIINSGRQQLVNQSESELTAAGVNYQIKINQMGFGFRGQSDNLAIINAALAKVNGQELNAQQRNIIKQILQNEIKARNIEYATLVGKDKRIIVSANSERRGEVFNPNNLIDQVFNDPKQIQTSEIVPWEDIKKENPPLLSLPEFSENNQNLLVRYTVTPVFRPSTQEVIGALVSGDVINGKNTIVESTIDEFKSGYAGIYQVEGEEFRIISAKGDNEIQTNQPLTTDILLNLALKNPREVATARDEVAGRKYTFTAQAIMNNQDEPVAILVRGTPENALEDILANSLAVQTKTAGAIILISILLIILSSRAIADRIELLKATTSKFASGEYDARADVLGKDEIGNLAETFNDLADNILKNETILLLDANQAALFQRITGARTVNENDIQRTFDNTLAEAKEILKVDRLVIYRFNPDWTGYISNEAGDDDLPSALDMSINDPCIPLELRQGYLNGRVVATENVYQAGFAPEHEQLMHRLEIKSNLVVPMITQGQLFALLIAHHCREYHVWSEREIAFLEQVATRYGVILDRVNIIKNQVLVATRAEQLKDITSNLAISLSREEILDLTVNAVRSALGCDRTIVYEFDDSWQGTIIAESVASGYPRALGSQIMDPCFAEKYVEQYEQGRVQATTDIYKAGLTQCHLQQLAVFEVKANLVAPILVNGKLIALLICHQCSQPRYWEANEIDLFTQIATQTGLALERVRLYSLQQKSEAEQREGKERLQQRALELLMQVDPVSRGDLTIRASVTEDEIGTIADSYNATIESLRKIVSQVQLAALQVSQTTSSRQIEVVVLQEEIAQQVQNIADALRTVNLMNESSQLVSQSAQEAEQVLMKAQESVQTGDSAMNSTVKSIMEIRSTVQQATEQMKRLGETTENISNVVALISRFAAQTHMLALKASIEAARAGEQGQGFAVIADEVRNLATQSARATADIEQLVNNILTETKTVVLAMEEGNELVAEGSNLVEETRKSLNQITAATLQVNQLVEAIASTALEQSENSEEMKMKITDVAQVAEKTNLSVNQLSESFEQLQQLAGQLESNVSQFKIS
jgi:methyl-accepting chemotaxis protein PixJ